MNYPIQTVCYEYYAKDEIDINIFKYKVNRIYFDYTTQVNEVMMNLLDSHDTARFITESNGDKDKLLMAFVFELFYLGCTSVYYGTEIGLDGENDPDCRKSMKWDTNKWDKELFGSYKKLIEIANNNEVIKNGEFRWIENKSILAFKRFNNNEEICIYLNNSKRKIEIDLNNTNDCVDLLTNNIIKKYSKIKIEEKQIKILKF
jgi:glycosidase